MVKTYTDVLPHIVSPWRQGGTIWLWSLPDTEELGKVKKGQDEKENKSQAKAPT
jgi:hypothetical protein